jgi:hypothetical protein
LSEPSEGESSGDESSHSAQSAAGNIPTIVPGGTGHADEGDESAEETEIVGINGHCWVRGNMEFQVMWSDDDVTWEPLSNVNDCAAMDEYLVLRDVADPLLLPKRKYLIDKAVSASN